MIPQYFSSRLGGLSFLGVVMLLLCWPSGEIRAQVSNNFEDSPAGTNAYQDLSSPLTAHALVNNPLPQTQPNADASGSQLGYQVLYTPTRTDGSGFGDGDLIGVVDFTVPASSMNSMGNLTVDLSAAPPPAGGTQVYVIEDSDGLASIQFSPVSLAGVNDASLTMNYILASTSYEASAGSNDRFKIYLLIDEATEVVLVEQANDMIVADELWKTINQDLSAYAGMTVQLIVEADFNSASEEMMLDNISFSGGVISDGSGCIEPSISSLSVEGGEVCPGLPFRILIDGNLGNATEWHIYADQAATNLVATTSGGSYDFFTGVSTPTTYFVRGEGGCTTSESLMAITVTLADGASCAPSSPPGTSFEEPLGASTPYVDGGDPSMSHRLENNQGQPTVFFSGGGTELGFTIDFTPTRTGGSSGGLTDGEEFGVSNDPTNAFPDGSQGLRLEDPDGMVRVEFSPVDMTGVDARSVNFRLFINNTSYEESNGAVDSFRVFFLVDETEEIELIGGGGSNINSLFLNNWVTVTSFQNLFPEGATVQLVVEADFDAASEFIMIDDIRFSGGRILDCTDDVTPPVVVCPADTIIDLNENRCSANLDAVSLVSATDDCSDNLTLISDLSVQTEIRSDSSLTVTVTATDEAGNSDDCSFMVTAVNPLSLVVTCSGPDTIIRQISDTVACNYLVGTDAMDATDFLQWTNIQSCLSTQQTYDYTGTNSLSGAVFSVGDTTINLVIEDMLGRRDSCSQVIRVLPPAAGCGVVNVREQLLPSDALTVYPNPTAGALTIRISAATSIGATQSLTLYDLNGRTVTEIPRPVGNQAFTWQGAANLASGVYLLRLRTDRGILTQRVQILH